MKALKSSLLVLFAGSSLLLAGCANRSLDVTRSLKAQALQAPVSGPQILAAYQPWFGRPGHMDVGYSSHDRVVLEEQVRKAKEMGIAGFVVNWYGPAKDFEDRSYAMLQETAASDDFKVAILYDEHVDEPDRAVDAAISDLRYAYERYIGPTATLPRDAYLRYQGRPVIFIFPKEEHTNWRRIRDAVSQWEEKPLLIYKGTLTQQPDAFDGFYAWVQPDDSHWSSDGSNVGAQYLENFYKTMSGQYANKLAVGAAWPGFDDSKASWTRNRKMQYKCGRTFDESMHAFQRYFGNSRPLPFLMIETWNDYEEGTAIERGIDRCNGKDASRTAGSR